jgi:ABC-type uncharacterized transport system permease subunit
LRWDDEDDVKKDRLFRDYDTVLKESAILTTFGGVLFGFLLNISVRGANQLMYAEKIILVLALFSITIAVSLFIMPVIYHHLQFPYTDLDKFKRRAHRFIIFGLIPTAFTLYLGMVLTFLPLINDFAYFVAGLPFALVYFLYRMRK